MTASIITLERPNRPMGAAGFLLSWEALEQGLMLLAAPDKAPMVADTVSALRQLQFEMRPAKLLIEILAATAWITDDTCPAGGSGGGAPMT